MLSLCFSCEGFQILPLESMRAASALGFLICILAVTLGWTGCAGSWYGVIDTGLHQRPCGSIRIPSTDFCIQFFLLHLVSLVYIFRLLRATIRGLCRPRRRLGKRSLKRLTRCAPQLLRRYTAKEMEIEGLTQTLIHIFPYV